MLVEMNVPFSYMDQLCQCTGNITQQVEAGYLAPFHEEASFKQSETLSFNQYPWSAA